MDEKIFNLSACLLVGFAYLINTVEKKTTHPDVMAIVDISVYRKVIGGAILQNHGLLPFFWFLGVARVHTMAQWCLPPVRIGDCNFNLKEAHLTVHNLAKAFARIKIAKVNPHGNCSAN